MNNIITYSDFNSDIDDKIRKKKVIPYSIFPGEKFHRGTWYYSRYYNNFFKVLDIETINGEDFISIRTDDNRYSCISTDLCTDDLMLEKDKKEIYKTYIFNSNIPYTGAEIRYWFFMHDIDCFNTKYSQFWKYVDRYSKCALDERKKYRCYAKIDKNGNLTNCRVKEYDTQLVANKEKANRDYHNKDIDFMKKEMKHHEKVLKKYKNKNPRE